MNVRFIDYGNTEDVKWMEMAELPHTLQSIPPLARRYTLYGVSFKHPPQSDLYEQVILCRKYKFWKYKFVVTKYNVYEFWIIDVELKTEVIDYKL